MYSLASCGKTLHSAEFLALTNTNNDPSNPPNGKHNDDGNYDDVPIEGLWYEESKWYAAEGVDYYKLALENDGKRMMSEFVKALSKHCDYGGPGRYCVVRWEDNETVSLLPEMFVRRKGGIGRGVVGR